MRKQQKNNWLGLAVVLLAALFLFLYQFPWDFGQTETAPINIIPDLQVESQPPGKFFIVKKALVLDGGFIVAHQDIGGVPGAVLGHSAYLRPGMNTSMVVVVDMATVVGQSIFVTLYSDNGDYQLTGEDVPIVDSQGQTITRQLVIVNQELLNARGF